jgi:hypothetical protein
MKNEEDEAFDELAKRQGSWGGGFKAKQAMAADKMQEPDWKTMPPKDAPLVQWVKEQTAPQPAQEQRPWVGLTPEDILGLFDEHNLYGSKLVEFARAVETKIKEKNNG